jgi:sugar phosphate isomerase/epimerase
MAVNWASFAAAEPTPEWPLETVLEGVAAAGFLAVGLDHYSLGARDAADVAALLQARGLRCSDVGIVPVGALDLRHVERLAATATAVGARLAVAALSADVSHADAVHDLRAAASVLAPAGVRLAFEFTAYGNVRSLAQAVALCEDVGWERCGLLVDAWHVFRGGESLADIAALDGGRIALVHVDDGAAEPLTDGTNEGRFHRLVPGTGSFDLDGFFDALDVAGYEGPICLEVLSDDLRALPPAEGAARLYSSLRCRTTPARACRGTPPRPRPRRSS